MSTLESSIRIGAVVDQALGELRKLKTQIDAVNASASKPVAGTPGGGLAPAIAQSGKEAEAAARKAARDLERQQELDHQRQLREERRRASEKLKAERQASAEIERIRRQSANQARQLAPQLTDIGVGLATGQSPFLVLLQQGGQLKDIYGGVGNAFRALMSVLTPARLVIGGVATAITAVAVAAFQGWNQTDKLNKSLAATGNAQGTSIGKIDAQVRQVAAAQNAAIGDVRATMAALVATGAYTDNSLASTARAVTALAKVTGQSSEDAIKAFEGQADGVAAWAAKANKSYNFLTADQYRYIRALEAQGRTQDALRVANEAFANAMESRQGAAIGSLERAWNAVGTALSSVWDRLKDIGRDETPEQRVQALTERLNALETLRNRRLNPALKVTPAESPELADLRAQLDAASEVIRLRNRAAAANAERSQREQRNIAEDSQAFRAAQQQADQAASQRLLQQRLAALNAQQALVDEANARGELSAQQHSERLAQIERQRLQAQAVALQRQIELERNAVVEKPEDVKARDSRVTSLEAQYIELQSRIAQAASKTRQVSDAAALEASRQAAAEWAQVWQRAEEQLRGLRERIATAEAARAGDPADRARREASVQTEAMRRQVADLQRDLQLRIDLTVDPQQKELLQQQLREVAQAGGQAVSEATRAATFTSLRSQLDELLENLRLAEQAIDDERLSTEEAEARKFAARDAALPQLRELLALYRQLAATPGERNAVIAIEQDLARLQDRTTEMTRTLRGDLQSGFGQMFRDIATGSSKALDAVLNFTAGVAGSLLDLIGQRLGAQLADSLLPTGGGGVLSTVGSFLAGLFHSGGVVGTGAGMQRAVSPLAWLGAPRYHTEGIVGLRPRERAIIALDGEEVLQEDNPRHVKNFRPGAAGGNQISVTVNGAQGSAPQQSAAAAELGRMVEAAVDQWAARQSRVGGILARRGG